MLEDQNETWSDLCFVRPHQDAFDALSYFHLALAAAVEDRAKPEALYVVYMKLAEIHGSHMPDAQLCQVYRARAQSLKKVLAGEESAAGGEENMVGAGGVNSDPDVECTNTPVPSVKEFKDVSLPRTCEIQKSSEDAYSDTRPDKRSGGHCEASASETDTIGSRSHSDSILTESFDTAKEQISDSCSSSDTLQTDRSHVDDKDFGNGQSLSGHMAHMSGDIKYAPTTESDVPKDQDTDTRLHEDVCEADADNAESFDIKL